MKMHRVAAAVWLSGCAMVAQAFPQISMSYLSPSAVIASTDSIEVWVHVSADRPIGNALGFPYGFDASDIPTAGWGFDNATGQWVDNAKFASYTSLSVGPGWGCSPSCDMPGYDFQALYSSSDPARPSLMGGDQMSLRTGDFLVGTYVPKGDVAPGTYPIPIVPELQFNVHGFSASGLSLVAGFGVEHVISACAGNQLSVCGMTRTVMAAVPEPGTFEYGLLGAVALGLWWQGRRRAAI